MTSFDKREANFEAKFARDAEIDFRVMARRNKLVGLWAAHKLGMAPAEADAYAATIIAADFEAPGEGDVLHKLRADLVAGGIDIGEAEVRAAMAEQLIEARRQLQDVG